MRLWRPAAALLLVTAALAGCVTPADEGLEEASTPTSALDPAAVEAPEEADVEAIEDGVRLVLEDVELPLETEIAIPEGTTMVRIQANHDADQGVILPLARHADSGAYRCVPALRTAWNVGVDDATSCSGLTALDHPPTNWTLEVYGQVFNPVLSTPVVSPGSGSSGTAELVQVDLLTVEPGGVVDEVDTANVTERHHEVGETTTHEVTSHDGADLHVEVTTPKDGHGQHPTLLVSSPYTTFDRQAGERPYDHLVRDYVPRGYNVVVADVRGFGKSDGCVEVWGPNEQKDQAVLVDWVTDQDWSDGSVGMYGISYPGTTPVEAAVQDPEGLEAIVTTAGVIDAYRDWHFGGVPNGESVGSPMAYYSIGAETTTEDPAERARETANGVCDPTLIPDANDPRSTYDAYYEARNLSARADDVTAAVMVEHGYDDPNVKSAMQQGWFNDLDVPKLGLFGHWDHQPGARADEATLRMAWMEHFVKGKDLGLDGISRASIAADGDRYRESDAWPDPTATDTPLYPAFGDGELSREPADGQGSVVLDGVGASGPSKALVGERVPESRLVLTGTFDEPLRLAGAASLDLVAELEGAGNAYVAAQLFEVQEDGPDKLVTFGWANLAHRDGHDAYEPVPPGEAVEMALPFLPTEQVFEAGDTVKLVVRGVNSYDWARSTPGQSGRLVLHGGEDGTALELPTLDEGAYEDGPPSVAPSAGPWS